jgi:hypothetical protein
MRLRHLAHLPPKPTPDEGAQGAVMHLFLALETICG